tara:strand:- start:1585 stop:1884 length:300 start_codon:yes stop_codon:yes gene_type:complete
MQALFSHPRTVGHAANVAALILHPQHAFDCWLNQALSVNDYLLIDFAIKKNTNAPFAFAEKGDFGIMLNLALHDFFHCNFILHIFILSRKSHSIKLFLT